MSAAILTTSSTNHCSHNDRLPRRWCEPSTLTATACVFELIETTTSALVVKKKPVVNVGAARHREALRRAKVLTATDPTTLEIRSGDFYKDFAAESRRACLESKQEIRLFEERRVRTGDLQIISERQRREPAQDAWSPDAAAISEAAAAAAVQPEGLGVGPRVPLVDAYGIFRVLNLTERGITTVDPAFAHFTNLTELDLGRNRLHSLGNLPEGLVTLSCAANELSGRALDGNTTLPLLSSLDLSYNKLGMDSLLATTPKRLSGRPLASTNLDNGNSRRALGVAPPTAGSVHFHEKFPVLEHLDLSWNSICELGQLVRALSPLRESLRHLFLAGNPICLLSAYRERILSRSCGPRLLVLDDLRVSDAERGLAAAAAMGHGGQGRSSSDRTAVPENGEGWTSHEPLDVVHFGVKLLGLSRLPDLGTTADSGETAAAAAADATAPVATTTTTTTTAPAVVPGGGKGGEEQGESESPTPNRWGEIEFQIPSGAGNNTTSATTGPGTFLWAPEVTPPDTGGKRTDEQQPPLSGEDHGEEQTPGVSAELEDGDHRGGDGKPWNTTISVPPSKAVRDGVCFRGLRVLLFSVDEEEQQQAVMATEPGQREGETDGHFPENDGDSKAGDGVEREDPAGNGEAAACHANRAQKRQRRLVGRGYLALSAFLDVAWMRQEQQQQRLGQQQSGIENGVATAPESHAADHHTGEKAADGDTIGGAVGVKVSGTCDLMLEPWVVENLRQGVARRKRQREERKEAARLEAEVNAANDPKGKNAKDAAAAAAAKGQEEEEEEEEIGASPSASAQLEVTLNNDAALRAFALARSATTKAATAAAAGW